MIDEADEVVIDEADEGGEAPCWAHRTDELDLRHVRPSVLGSNTILYCDQWSEVVDFYRTRLGLRTTMEREWFVEFEIHPGARLSVADAGRTTVGSGDGSGLTLSWQVEDVADVRAWLTACDVEVSPVVTRWGGDCVFVFDPSGNRIEFWSDSR